MRVTINVNGITLEVSEATPDEIALLAAAMSKQAKQPPPSPPPRSAPPKKNGPTALQRTLLEVDAAPPPRDAILAHMTDPAYHAVFENVWRSGPHGVDIVALLVAHQKGSNFRAVGGFRSHLRGVANKMHIQESMLLRTSKINGVLMAWAPLAEGGARTP